MPLLKGNKLTTRKTLSRSSPILTSSYFCHTIRVNLYDSGEVVPSRIVLGNQGDGSITKLEFDFSNFTTTEVLSDFHHILYLQNNNRTLMLDFEGIENNISTFIINPSITEKSGSYKILYALEEIDPITGNINTEEEIFISNEFTGIVNENNWIDEINDYLDVEGENDVLQYLSKPSITIIPSETNLYKITVDSSLLGNKGDRYIKRITFNNQYADLHEGFNNRYAIFIKNNHVIGATKFIPVDVNEITMTAWIPESVTAEAGEVIMLIVALTDDREQRWVSNSLSMTVSNNFLDKKELPIIGVGRVGYIIVD